MRSAGLRELRQNLSKLLAEVRKGREVVITDRGRPLARLVPYVRRASRPFPSHAWLRERIHLKGKPLSETIAEEREDRL